MVIPKRISIICLCSSLVILVNVIFSRLIYFLQDLFKSVGKFDSFGSGKLNTNPIAIDPHLQKPMVYDPLEEQNGPES